MGMGAYGGGPMGPGGPGVHGVHGQMAPQAAGHFGGHGIASGSAHYEFTPAENATLGKVASRAKWCGVISLVSGVLLTGFSVLVLVLVGLGLVTVDGMLSAAPAILGASVLPMAVVNLVVGFFYVKAGDALTEVTTTEGHDVAHMMTALARFKWAFQLESIMAALAMIASLTVGIVSRVMS